MTAKNERVGVEFVDCMEYARHQTVSRNDTRPKASTDTINDNCDDDGNDKRYYAKHHMKRTMTTKNDKNTKRIKMHVRQEEP